MPRELRLNAFASQTPVHPSPGLWRHPSDRSRDFKTLRYWTELARTPEDGLFDGLFLADGIGVNDVHGGSPDSALRHGAQVPKHDPLLLVSAMAYVTKQLGFGVTHTLSFEPPALLARRFTTQDHLTKGRIGWNIVTGCYDSGAKAFGRSRVTAHDERYEVAEEYMELVYRLWEQSWEDDAVLGDRASGVYALPEKVHTIPPPRQIFRSRLHPFHAALAAANPAVVPSAIPPVRQPCGFGSGIPWLRRLSSGQPLPCRAPLSGQLLLLRPPRRRRCGR